ERVLQPTRREPDASGEIVVGAVDRGRDRAAGGKRATDDVAVELATIRPRPPSTPARRGRARGPGGGAPACWLPAGWSLADWLPAGWLPAGWSPVDWSPPALSPAGWGAAGWRAVCRV